MDLYQIRYFLAIAETGSFTKAADRLFVSQPSLSAGIKKLEQVLDVTLFDRGGRRVVLTPAGKLFQKKAKIFLDNYQATLRELREFRDQPVLRLGTLRTIRITCLADLIYTFQQQFPSVLIELVDGSFSELCDQLEQGDVDLVMTVLDGYEAPKTSLALFQQRRVLAVSTNNPLANRATVQLADLDGQPFIDRLHCERYQEFQRLFTSIQPRIVYRADQEEWVFSLIAAGLGLSIMPEWHDVPGVIFIPIADVPLQRTVGLVWRGSYEAEAIDQFLACASNYNWGNL